MKCLISRDLVKKSRRGREWVGLSVGSKVSEAKRRRRRREGIVYSVQKEERK